MVKEKEIKSEETITVNKSAFDAIMKRLERVEYASDKSRTNRFDEGNKKMGRVVNVRTMDGNIVTSWRMVEDIVKKDTNGEWTEKQTIELTFKDGKTKNYPYARFSADYQKIPCDVVSSTKLEDEAEIAEKGQVVFKLKTPDLETIEIGDLYVN